MIFSKTTEYAVRVLTYMTGQDKELFTARHLHEQLNIPYKYLTRLMTNLVKSGCLTSIQGREGGFKVLKAPDKFTIADIVEAVEGIENFHSCVLGLPECSDENPCAMHYIWEKNRKNLLDILHNTTLSELTNRDFSRY